MNRRKLPKQKRGKQKVEAVLKTAAKLFADVGYDATTTRHIGEHANVPIGTIYQFFRNKKEILITLAEYYGERIDAQYDKMIKKGIKNCSKDEFVDEMINFFFEFDKANPEYYQIFNFASSTVELKEVTEILDQIIISRLGNIYKSIDPEFQPQLYEIQLLALYKTMLFLFLNHKDCQDKKRQSSIRQEMQNIYSFYLERLIT
jgi:AcrR family transcriptional regulator